METSEYLQKVYGGLRDGFLSVTTFAKDGEARTKWFDTGQLDEMAARAFFIAEMRIKSDSA